MKVHIFDFQFPRIEEGLTYREVEVAQYWDINTVDAPVGAFIYCKGKWYRKLPNKLYAVLDLFVPKTIRALALICVIN